MLTLPLQPTFPLPFHLYRPLLFSQSLSELLDIDHKPKRKNYNFKAVTLRGNDNHDRASTRGHSRPLVSYAATWVSFSHPSIFYTRFHLHSWSQGAMPAAMGRRQGHTLDELPFSHWGNIERETIIHTHSHLWTIKSSQFPSHAYFWTAWKPESWERTHKDTGRTSKLHSERNTRLLLVMHRC